MIFHLVYCRLKYFLGVAMGLKINPIALPDIRFNLRMGTG
jgi:hypothetical protein